MFQSLRLIVDISESAIDCRCSRVRLAIGVLESDWL